MYKFTPHIHFLYLPLSIFRRRKQLILATTKKQPIFSFIGSTEMGNSFLVHVYDKYRGKTSFTLYMLCLALNQHRKVDFLITRPILLKTTYTFYCGMFSEYCHLLSKFKIQIFVYTYLG